MELFHFEGLMAFFLARVHLTSGFLCGFGGPLAREQAPKTLSTVKFSSLYIIQPRQGFWNPLLGWKRQMMYPDTKLPPPVPISSGPPSSRSLLGTLHCDRPPYSCLIVIVSENTILLCLGFCCSSFIGQCPLFKLGACHQCFLSFFHSSPLSLPPYSMRCSP